MASQNYYFARYQTETATDSKAPLFCYIICASILISKQTVTRISLTILTHSQSLICIITGPAAISIYIPFCNYLFFSLYKVDKLVGNLYMMILTPALSQLSIGRCDTARYHNCREVERFRRHATIRPSHPRISHCLPIGNDTPNMYCSSLDPRSGEIYLTIFCPTVSDSGDNPSSIGSF